MSHLSMSTLPPTLDELQARVRSLESELDLLRSKLEEQTWRMAELVQENASLKSDAGAGPGAAPRRGPRTRQSIISREEMEFVLSMGLKPGAPTVG